MMLLHMLFFTEAILLCAVIIIIIIIITLFESQIILAEHECCTNWGDCKSNKSNQIKSNVGFFLRRGENRSSRRKTSRSRVENQQTQPTYDAGSGNQTRDTLVEGERSHHYTNPAPCFGRNLSLVVFVEKTNSNIALRVFRHFFLPQFVKDAWPLSVGHPRGTHSRYAIGCCLIPLGICGLKNNSRRITYGIGCVWRMPSLSL